VNIVVLRMGSIIELKLILTQIKEISLICEAANENDLQCLFKTYTPDYILINTALHTIETLQIIRSIVYEYRGTIIIAISDFEQMDKIMPLIHAGARNYILKNNLSVDSMRKRLGLN